MQDCRISLANALGIPKSCTKPSISSFKTHRRWRPFEHAYFWKQILVFSDSPNSTDPQLIVHAVYHQERCSRWRDLMQIYTDGFKIYIFISYSDKTYQYSLWYMRQWHCPELAFLFTKVVHTCCPFCHLPTSSSGWIKKREFLIILNLGTTEN